jgi:hypothetical protein
MYRAPCTEFIIRLAAEVPYIYRDNAVVHLEGNSYALIENG